MHIHIQDKPICNFFNILKIMKKVIFSLVAVLTSVSMSAQWAVSGSLGFSTEDPDPAYAAPEEYSAKSTSLFFSPSVGYQLNDKLMVGASLNFYSERNLYNDKDHNSTSFEIAPFVRYSLCQIGKIKFLLEGAPFYSHTKDEEPFMDGSQEPPVRTIQTIKRDEIGVSVAPCIEFEVTEHLSLLSGFGYLEYSKTIDSSSSLDLYLSSGLSFGLQYKF